MANETIRGFKGFDKDLRCQGHQYEVGKEYEHPGEVKCCPNESDLRSGLGGFHFCENPIDVWSYYGPGNSRFCEVEGFGKTDKRGDDSKVVVSNIRIGAEIKLTVFIDAAVKFILDRVDWKNKKESNTGYQSAATNTGYRSAATVGGKESIACGLGIQNRASGAIGCWLVLVEWKQGKDYNWRIKSVKSVVVDGKKIKANTFYELRNGKFVLSK